MRKAINNVWNIKDKETLINAKDLINNIVGKTNTQDHAEVIQFGGEGLILIGTERTEEAFNQMLKYAEIAVS